MEMDAKETEQQLKVDGFALEDLQQPLILELNELLDFIKIMLLTLKIEFLSEEMALKLV